MDEEEVKEAERLIKTFGHKAILVVEEIMNYDKQDKYFWICVRSTIIKIEMNEEENSRR